MIGLEDEARPSSCSLILWARANGDKVQLHMARRDVQTSSGGGKGRGRDFAEKGVLDDFEEGRLDDWS